MYTEFQMEKLAVLCMLLPAWEMWMSSRVVFFSYVYTWRPSPNQSVMPEKTQKREDCSWCFACFTTWPFPLRRWFLLWWRCLQLCVSSKRKFPCHFSPFSLTLHPHSSQLQSSWHSCVLKLPFILSASTTMRECTSANSFTKKWYTVLPRICATVQPQQEQCFLTPVYVNMLRHQLHPGEVKCQQSLS